MTREDLIVAHMPIVRSVAMYLRTRLPYTIEVDDLIGVGYVALIKAIDSYDPNHPKVVPLKLWIRYKVRGEIIEAYSGRNYRYELHAPLPPPERFPTEPPAPVLDRLLTDERQILVELASRRLRRRERAVLTRSLKGQTMASVGRRLGISERRAGQLRQLAVARVQETVGAMEALG